MSPALADFLFETVNFLLLAAVLGYVFFRPVRRALDRERDARAREAEHGQRLMAEAEEARAAAQAERDALEAELDARRDAALADLQRETEDTRRRARAADATERQAQAAALRADREAETQALADEVGRVAGASVGRLLADLPGPDLDDALLRRAVAELGALPEDGRRPARVDSARPLTPEARSALTEVLGEGFAEQVIDDLGAGVRVTTPAGQVDATAAAIARTAAREISRQGARPASEGDADA